MRCSEIGHPGVECYPVDTTLRCCAVSTEHNSRRERALHVSQVNRRLHLAWHHKRSNPTYQHG